jgi:DNA-binding NtrC family response regulator
VEGVSTGEAGLELLSRAEFDLVLLDVNLPGRSGIEVLEAAQPMAPSTEFIMITAFASIDTAVDAMKRGACDYLRKPLRTDELLRVIARALANVAAHREVARLKRRVPEGLRQRMVGRSPVMEQLWDRIEKVAPTRATVLITGETGTGKELVARAIHELSPRAREPFVASNCSALPETLLESELFGHVKGSFTGATNGRRGLFEEASGGTLFMDEVSTLTSGIQVKLLRVVQERVIQRVGSNTQTPVDLRLLAATNIDLRGEVERGAFRADLFYRLNVFALRVPPLRERSDDIPLLAQHFLQRTVSQYGVAVPTLPASTLRAMVEYDWPGNVRQLENYVEAAVIANQGGIIEFEPPVAPEAVTTRAPSGGGLAELERERIMQALAETGGHHGRAAALLGIDRRTVERKLRRYALEGRTG